MAELEELEQENLDEALLDVGTVPSVDLPSVPVGEPTAPSTSKLPIVENAAMAKPCLACTRSLRVHLYMDTF